MPAPLVVCAESDGLAGRRRETAFLDEPAAIPRDWDPEAAAQHMLRLANLQSHSVSARGDFRGAHAKP